MKELPEKWCINVSDFKVGEKVVKAMKKPQWYLKDPEEVAYFNFTELRFDFWTTITRDNNQEYTEISFEDFETLVLGKTPKTRTKRRLYLLSRNFTNNKIK